MINIKKSMPAPNCLKEEKKKVSGKYNTEEVIERLKADFYNKCYICEDAPQSINVEHFKPKERFPDLTFEWSNLFYSCTHCNSVKHAKKEYDDILDCTNPNHPVADWIEYKIDLFPKSKPQFKNLNQESIIENTTKLLDEVFNGEKTPSKTVEAQNLRERLIAELNRFRQALEVYFEYKNAADRDEEDFNDCLRRIKRHLDKSSKFTAFKWWVIRANEELFIEFCQYIHQN